MSTHGPRLTSPALIVVLVWFVLIGVLVARAMGTAIEPPVWDALTYVQKAKGFWEALAAGRLQTFGLEPTLRPPGTVAMAYPLGFDPGFFWFYVRSIVFPIGLLIAAVYIAGLARDLPRAGHWTLAALALVLAGMPFLYQFQANDILPSFSNWGLVDGFLTGVAAVAAAAAVRSARERSLAWAFIAAATACFSLLIKPTGLVVMGVTGVTWLSCLWFPLNNGMATIRRDPRLWRFVKRGLGAALVMYTATLVLCGLSPYMSFINIGFGRRALAILQNEFALALDMGMALWLVRASFGIAVGAVVIVGVLIAFRMRERRGFGVAALVSVLAGLWFMHAQADASQVRYVMPFMAMAFVTLVPPLAMAANRLGQIALAAAVVPTFVITLLLALPQAPVPWQRALGVNLLTNAYAAEHQQAEGLMAKMIAQGQKNASMYIFDLAPALRNIAAVFNYANIIDPRSPRMTVLLPISWQRPSAFDLDQMARATYIGFEPIPDAAVRKSLLAQQPVQDTSSVTRLANAWFGRTNRADEPTTTAVMEAWFTELTPDDGVEVVSETRVRLLRVTDALKFDAALERLRTAYSWPEAFRTTNPQRWWSLDELKQGNTKLLSEAITFQSPRTGGEPEPVVRIHSARLERLPAGVEARFWIETTGLTAANQWYLFAHVVDPKGTVLAQTHVSLFPSPDGAENVRSYALFFGPLSAGATHVGFGVYRPERVPTPMLEADTGHRDWNNKRAILSLFEH